MRQFPNPTELPPTDVGIYLAMDHFDHTLNEILTTTNDDNELTPLSDHSVANISSPPPPPPPPRNTKRTFSPVFMKHMT